jgi:hypothetical protein
VQRAHSRGAQFEDTMGGTRAAKLCKLSPKGDAGEEVPRGCAKERAFEGSTKQSAPEARLFEQGERIRRAKIGISTSVARERAGADRGSKGPLTTRLHEPGPKGGGGEEAPRGCAMEHTLEGSARQCAPEVQLFEQGVGVRHADTGVSTSVAAGHAGANRCGSAGTRAAKLYELSPKGGVGEEVPRGRATECALEDSAKQCAPAVQLVEQGVGVRRASTGESTSVARGRAISDQAKVRSLRSDWVRPGPRGYAQGGGREGGVRPSTGCQALPERELDEDFLCDEEEHPEGDEEGSKQQAGPSYFTAPQYDRHMRRAVLSTMRTVNSLYPLPEKDRLLCKTAALAVVKTGLSTLDKIFTESDALQWADGFCFDDSETAEGERLLDEAGGDLTVLARKRYGELLGERLNADRIDEWISLDNPELERLKSIAVHGVSVPVAEGFTPNGTEGKFPPLRPKYVRMASTVNKLLHSSFVSKRLAVILPKKRVLALRVTAALSAAGWTEARGKVKGRPIIDPKDINSKEAKLRCDESHGKIVYPTLQDLVRQIMDFF